jgi:hypothetical protein
MIYRSNNYLIEDDSIMPMRNYPATLLRVLENKLDEGHEGDEEIPFTKEDLERATEELEIDVRDVMEIPSAYSSSGSLPDEITEHGYTSVEYDSDGGESERYLFTRD